MQACAYIRDNGDSSKVKRRKGAGKDRRKVGKKLSRRKLGEGGALEVGNMRGRNPCESLG